MSEEYGSTGPPSLSSSPGTVLTHKQQKEFQAMHVDLWLDDEIGTSSSKCMMLLLLVRCSMPAKAVQGGPERGLALGKPGGGHGIFGSVVQGGPEGGLALLKPEGGHDIPVLSSDCCRCESAVGIKTLASASVCPALISGQGKYNASQATAGSVHLPCGTNSCKL